MAFDFGNYTASANGTDDRAFGAASAVVTAAPFTVHAWQYRPSAASIAGGTLWSVANSGVGNQLLSGFQSGGGDLSFLIRNGGGNVAAGTGPTGVGLDAWTSCGFVASSTTNRQVFVNGAGGTVNTTSLSPSGLNQTAIGTAYKVTPGDWFGGFLGEVAIWNVALTVHEIAALAKWGRKATTIRPASLVMYQPMRGAINETGSIGPTFSAIGSASAPTKASTHPPVRIVRIVRPQSSLVPPPGITLPRITQSRGRRSQAHPHILTW